LIAEKKDHGARVILSIEESIQRLKAEIIAQDWGLSTKRIDLLEAAFSCLQERFKNRKAAHAILIMAGSVLSYVKRKGENTPSNSIDFLKEAMAHIVNLYEADTFDPESEEKLFNGLYYRFNGLKKKIKEEREKQAGRSDEPADEEPDEEKSPVESEEEIEGLFFPDDRIDQIFIPETIARIKETITSLHFKADADTDLAEVDLLLNDLQMSLERAEKVGTTIKQLVANLQTVRQTILDPDGVDGEKLEQARATSGSSNSELTTKESEQNTVVKQSIKKCPPMVLRELIFDDISLYVEESAISFIRTISVGRQRSYIRNSSVPLKDFASLFRGLAKQFEGHLGNIPDKKLKKLTLPVMMPQGLGLSVVPENQALTLVCVTNGQWNGALLCSSVSEVTTTMVGFQAARNGDILGDGFCEEGRQFLLLDTVSLLRREGFLTMV
jgi:hypothetical protein